MNRRSLWGVLAGLALAAAVTWGIGLPDRSQAVFVAPEGNASNAFTTATLQAPTGLVAVAGPGAKKISLSWTASASLFAGGYDIWRSQTPGCCYAFVASVVGRLTTSHIDGGLAESTTYYHVLQASSQNWTSANSNEASATTPD